MLSHKFRTVEDSCALAIAIVNTVREPLVVLDHDLRVIAASRAFYRTFKVAREATEGHLFFELGDGQWDVPQLRAVLGKILPERGTIEDFDVEHEFLNLGRRTMSLNARQVVYEGGTEPTILLGIEDVTDRRALEAEKDSLLAEKDILLSELRHRVANSLQIIASIIMLKAKRVTSEETRSHLQDAHNRVLSVATVQKQLQVVSGGRVDIGSYLSKLCAALAGSMIADDRAITIKVAGEGGTATCREAESIGLIVTELVINSIKHAFNLEKNQGQITVTYDVSGGDWKLSVADDGSGRPSGPYAQRKEGLGTGIVTALARQLNAEVDTVSGPQGTSVSITHAVVAARKVRAA
ncbi:MAG: histidine kinase dimerization/phosphoacceptor domain -containing protein [Hyphomicrobiales bacterium]|nr:PAS domain-containing protein [Hyphomicrobiales bacterium]